MKTTISIAAALTAMIMGGAAHANSFTNGNFETLTNGVGELGYNTDAVGWTTDGYNRIFAPGTADTTGSEGQYGNLQLWGPGNGSANGLTATSPAGGNYVAFDPAYEAGALTQTVTGLTPGREYRVGFWWAAAQQEGFTGPTTEGWQVGFGGQHQYTTIVSNKSHGFKGWFHQAFIFTADSTSDVLSFFPEGGPPGLPPFALLDGVTLSQETGAVPEPATWAMMILGVAGIGGLARRRRAATTAMVAA